MSNLYSLVFYIHQYYYMPCTGNLFSGEHSPSRFLNLLLISFISGELLSTDAVPTDRYSDYVTSMLLLRNEFR